MLPPIRAISSTDVSFQNQTAPQVQQQPVNAPRLPDQIDTRSNTASIFAKANIRALSSETHLALNTLSLTETLSKLLNMPRLDSEATQAYSKRLVQALSVLPAPQRAALEQQLGRVLQGLTLAILVEVLKNPAGPDAARLSVLLEMSRFKGLDMAAKAVVSSYKQNVGADTQTGAALRPAMPTSVQLPPAQQPATVATAQAATTTTPAPASTSPQPPAGQPTPNPVAALQTASMSPVTGRQITTPPASGLAASSPATSAAATQVVESPAQNTFAPEPDVTPRTARATDAATTPAQKPVANSAASQHAEALAGKRVTAEPRSTVRHEIPVNARDYSTVSARAEARLMSMIAQEQFQGATAKDIENLLLAALTGKLPKRAEIGQPGLPPAFQTDEAAEFETRPQTASAQNVQSGTQTDSEEAAPAAPRPETQATSGALVDSKAMMLEQPALHTALAAALAKDGTPLPFVDYPLAKDEPESDAQHRGRWPSSGDEAEQDAEGEPQGHGGDQEERAAANDEGENGDLMVDVPEDEAHDSAEAYYLRMGGLA